MDYDVATCSELYKEYIRSLNYGDSISRTTDEYMVFMYKEKKFIVKFKLDFSFDFEDSFHYTRFSDFTYNRKINDDEKKEFESYIRENFVTSDRLSC